MLENTSFVFFGTAMFCYYSFQYSSSRKTVFNSLKTDTSQLHDSQHLKSLKVPFIPGTAVNAWCWIKRQCFLAGVFTPYQCNLCTIGKMPHVRRAALCNAALSVEADGIMSCGITCRDSLTFADDGHHTQKPRSSSQQIGVWLRFETSVWQGCTDMTEHKGTRIR